MRHMNAFRKGNSQREFHQRFASQSAMEYLMTYGWAILIIAVVLAALFELGVFNPMTFAPKASPGSCQVVRPEGAGTTNFISIEGECNGELPQYAAQFNGQSSYIVANIPNIPTGNEQRTVTAWFFTTDWQPASSGIGIFGYGTNVCTGENFYAAVGTSCSGTSPPGHVWVDTWCTCQDLTPYQPSGWSFVAYSYNGVAQNAYLGSGGSLNSVSEAFTANTPFTQFLIGAATLWNGGYTSYEFDGLISNVQVYNAALSANGIRALYQEGIGGAPIRIQNLVAWYPLNGNANDYSGNGNNGMANGVTYTSNWYSGYSAP